MKVSESIKFQQELINAKNRLDEEVRHLKLLQNYNQKALLVNSLEEFGELTIESFLEIFNEAKGVFYYFDQTKEDLRSIGQLDLDIDLSQIIKDETILNLKHISNSCTFLGGTAERCKLRKFLNLETGYISAIADINKEKRGIIIIGQSKKDSLFYPPPSEKNFSAFNLMTQNVGLLLSNIRFQDEIKHELEATKDLTKSLTKQKLVLSEEKLVLEDQVNERNKELEESNLRLKKEMALKESVAKELRAQKEELQRSNEDLSQFASVISHDLKTPLRNVMGFTKLLEQNYSHQLDNRGNEYLKFVYDGVKQFGNIIDDLLEFSKVTKGQITRSEINLNEVLINIENALKSTIKNNEATINKTVLPTIHADEFQIHSLIQNLVENAIKYRSHRKPIININTATDNDFHTVSISDNGIGIHKDYQEKVFNFFERLHNSSEYEGTGIGLTISKKIVERHGGRIWLESKENIGTTFYFTIPTQSY